MRSRSTGIALTLLLCGSTLALAQTSMTADEAKKKIEAAGYTMVVDIKPAGDGYTAFAMKGNDMLTVKVGKDGKVEPAE